MKKRKNTAPHLRLVTYLKIHRSFLLVNNEQEPTKYLWRTLNVADMTEKYPNKSKLDSTKWGPFFIDGWVYGPTLPMAISLWLVTWLADDSSMAGGESTLYGWSSLERTSLGKQTKCPQMELTAYGKGFSGSVCRQPRPQGFSLKKIREKPWGRGWYAEFERRFVKAGEELFTYEIDL